MNVIHSFQIAEKFNKQFPVGNKVEWRSSPSDPYNTLTVKTEAEDHYGTPICFFEEKSGFCSVEGKFVKYN